MKQRYNSLMGWVVCILALLMISSCSNEADLLLGKDMSEQEHLQKMKQLCAEYGWTPVEGATQDEVDAFLLSADYELAKDFFELIKNRGETQDAEWQ